MRGLWVIVGCVLLVGCGSNTSATATRVAEVATLTAVAQPTSTATPLPTLPPPPTINPTVRAYQDAQATQNALAREPYCRELAKLFAEYGQIYHPSMGPELVYLDLLRLMGIEPGSSASHSYAGAGMVELAHKDAYGCLGP